jgi:Cdc6-like AAA superfamily ATPase
MTKSKVWFIRRRSSHNLDMVRAAVGSALPGGEPPVERDVARSRLTPNLSMNREIGPSSLHRATGSFGAGTNDRCAPVVFASLRGRRQLAQPPILSSAPLREIFTPTRPKQSAALFSGRHNELRRIISGIEEQRAHIMIYGERGSGKTSLANVVAEKAEAAGYLVFRFVCSAEVSFGDIFSSFLQRIPQELVARVNRGEEIGRSNVENWDLQELLHVFDNVALGHLILIIDEYDRVTSETTKARLAELIKNLSDAAAPVTLLISGIAENVTELVGKHPSLQRALMAVAMPLMTADEIDGIIAAGEGKSGLRFDTGVRQSVIDLAQGLPYHAQLLCYFAARNAIWRHSNLVERKDLRYAVHRAADEAHSDIKLAYKLAIRCSGKTSFRDALFFAARCATDESGTFAAADVVATAMDGAIPPMSLLPLQRAFAKLSGPERGAVLRRVPTPGGVRYRFASQMLRHYVLCREAEERGLLGG